MTARGFFDGSRALIRQAADEALPADVRVGFTLTGEGGGEWTVSTDRGAAAVCGGLATPLDCVLVATGPDFLEMIGASSDARGLFMSGRLHLEGDIGLMLQLQRALKHHQGLSREMSAAG